MHHLYDQSQVNQNNPLRCNSHLLCLIKGNLRFRVVYAFIRTAILISEFGVPAVNLNIASDWERIGIKMTR